MNWTVVIFVFCAAAAMGAFLLSRLERSRPDWSARRRLWTAALILPLFIVFATFSSIGCTMVTLPVGGEGNRDLVIGVYGIIGGILSIIALIGSLVGAKVSARKLAE